MKKLNELEEKEIIEGLHNSLSNSNIVLKEEPRKLADEKMTKILEDGLIQELLEKYKKDKTKKKKPIDENKAFEEIEFIILKFYYAIYNNNVELYRKFATDKVSLGESIENNKLYLLNKELTDIFKNNKEYYDFIKKYDPAIKRFYVSIGNKDTELRDKRIKTFTNIIKKDKNYLGRKTKDHPPIYMNLLTERNIRVFGEDFLKNVTYRQKEVINSINYKMADEDLEKVKYLIKKYPNYEIKTKLTAKYLNSFTIDEIANMSEKHTIMFTKAAEEGIIPQLMEVIKINEKFECPPGMINEPIFTLLDSETISMLSDSAKVQLSKLKKMDTIAKDIRKIVNKDIKKKTTIKKKASKSVKNNKK